MCDGESFHTLPGIAFFIVRNPPHALFLHGHGEGVLPLTGMDWFVVKAERVQRDDGGFVRSVTGICSDETMRIGVRPLDVNGNDLP